MNDDDGSQTMIEKSMRMCCRFICLSYLFLAVPVFEAQVPNKALTNADVVKLVKAGVASDTIVLAIQHGVTKFDTSPDALIFLSKNKVGNAIIDAMLASNSKSASPASNAVTRIEPVQNLNDDLAKASLRALRAIDGEAGSSSLYSAPHESQTTREALRTMGANDTSTGVPRQTEESIDAADAEARTDQERAVVMLLRNLFALKLSINRNWRVAAIFGSPSVADHVYGRQPTQDMLKRQTLCSEALDSLLRNRIFDGTPQGCDDLSDPGFEVSP
jgi:hypothetical protein